MRILSSITLFLFILTNCFAQLPIGRDTLTVIENGNSYSLAWAGGINSSNVSNIDLNFDGIKDIVVFDKGNQFGTGKFRCFIKTGNAGQATYSLNPEVSANFPPLKDWAILLDYNNDNKEDIFCSTSAGIMVYKNVSASNTLSFQLEKSLLYSNYNPGGAQQLSNLYASSVGVPAIADVDNDGDLDVLSFASGGFMIEFHKNMSKELYGNSDTLSKFDAVDLCWGKVSETNCTVTFSQCPVMKYFYGETITVNKKSRHAGSCLTCIDIDSDNDKDLIMGDISCNVMQLVKNTGTSTLAVITDSTKLFPSAPQQIKMNSFPCVYLADIDGDSKKDMLATPNAFGSENFNSVWYYQNVSTTNTLSFNLIKKNQFQDEMIDVGQNSFPILFDYNADGKKDLLIGNFNYYNPTFNQSKLTLFQNIGTLAQPAFSLITRDYASLSTFSFNCVMPSAGDIDNDGDVDLIVGTSNGVIHWLKNTAGAGNVCNFSQVAVNAFSFTTLSAIASPNLFDVNNDGKLDIIIGTKNGRIAYYQNIGTPTSPSFTLVTNTFGNVNVQGAITEFGTDGFASPFIYKDGSVTKLLVGNVAGRVFEYLLPNSYTANATFTLINNNVNSIFEGGQSTLCYEDINNDNIRDLFVGNCSGGLAYYSSKAPNVSVKENSNLEKLDVNLFPNPVKNNFTIDVKNYGNVELKIIIHNALGEQISNEKIINGLTKISMTNYQDGIYFVSIYFSDSKNNNLIGVKKVIKN